MCKHFLAAAVLLVLTAVLLVGCGDHSSLRLLWSGQNQPGHLAARYGYFDGVEARSVDLETGQELVIRTEASVLYGDLTLSVQGPDGAEVYAADLADIGEEAIEIPASAAGSYRLVVRGEKAGGRYQVDYTTEDGSLATAED